MPTRKSARRPGSTRPPSPQPNSLPAPLRKPVRTNSRRADKLSIKGIGQDITAPFTVKRAGDAATYEGGFTLKRLQFKIGEGAWSDTDTVADEVQVKFRIVTTGNK